MKVLITGAFGNIGRATTAALLAHGHDVTLFDVPTRQNRRWARMLKDRVRVVWGDVRHKADLWKAVVGQEVVVHLAFVIPRLSATGRGSEEAPAWAREVNVEGTRRLVEVMEAQPVPPRLLFTSSLHIYGATQHLPPPRRVDDPPRPMEHYSRHKVEAEAIVRGSRLQWSVFRLAAALPVSLILDPGMFDVPLDNRIEFVHRDDVGLAVAHGVESQAIWGKVLHIGGGCACQLYYRDLVAQILGALGIGMLPDEAFARVPYPVDWLDTEESEALLHYQHCTVEHYLRDLKRLLGWRLAWVKVFRLWVRWHLLRQSPVLDWWRSWRLVWV